MKISRNIFGIILITLLIFVFVLTSFSQEKLTGTGLRITVTPGSNYAMEKNFGPFKVKLTPQMAFWLEDSNGKFLATLYVTYKSAKGAWGLPVDRPASLPIWAYKRGIESKPGIYMPTNNKPLPDSETSATPTGKFVWEWDLPKDLKAGTYLIKGEVNRSFDYNDTFKDKLSEKDPNFNAENGQPSVLYEGTINIGNKTSSIELKPVGYGHPIGKTGDVVRDISKITTALDMLSSIKIEYVKK
jgi:hypothetical protein